MRAMKDIISNVNVSYFIRKKKIKIENVAYFASNINFLFHKYVFVIPKSKQEILFYWYPYKSWMNHFSSTTKRKVDFISFLLSFLDWLPFFFLKINKFIHLLVVKRWNLRNSTFLILIGLIFYSIILIFFFHFDNLKRKIWISMKLYALNFKCCGF